MRKKEEDAQSKAAIPLGIQIGAFRDRLGNIFEVVLDGFGIFGG